jgi:hypothetical protein
MLRYNVSLAVSELERSCWIRRRLNARPFLPDCLSDVSFQAQTAPRTKTLANDIQKLGRILWVNIGRLQVSWREQ